MGNILLTASGPLTTREASLGSELVVNGDFAADSTWVKGVGWTIATGVASSDGSQAGDSLLSQSITHTQYKVYKTVYTATRSAGSIQMDLNGTDKGVAKSAAGTYTEYIQSTVATGANTFSLLADLDFVGTIDNVSCKLVAHAPVRINQLILTALGGVGSITFWNNGTAASHVITLLQNTTKKFDLWDYNIIADFAVIANASAHINYRGK